MSSLDIANGEKHKHKRQISNESFYTNTPYLQNNGSRLKFVHNSNRKKMDFTKSQKNTIIAQRVMSAKAHRIKQVHNELQELRCQVHELFNENRLLKNIQKRQDAALAKYEDNASALPKLLENHHAEVSALRAHSRTLRITVRDLEHRLTRSDTELTTLREQYSKLKKLADDKELSSRSDLQRKSEDLEQRLKEMEDKNSLLNRKLELDQKKHNQQMKNEISKRRLIEDDLNLTKIEIHRLKQILEDSGKKVLSDSTKFLVTPTGLLSSVSLRKKSAHNLLFSTNSVIQDNKPSLSKYASLPRIVKNKTNSKTKLQALNKIPEIEQLQNKTNKNLRINCNKIEHLSVELKNESLGDTSNVDSIDKSQETDNSNVEEDTAIDTLKSRPDFKNLDSFQTKEDINSGVQKSYQSSEKSENITNDEICKADSTETSTDTSENSESDSNKSTKKYISLPASSVDCETVKMKSNIKLKSQVKKQISFESKYGKQKNRASSNISTESCASTSTTEDKAVSDNDTNIKHNEINKQNMDIKRESYVASISPKLEVITNLEDTNECEKSLSIFSRDNDNFKFINKSTKNRSDVQVGVNFSREIGDLQNIYFKKESNRKVEKHATDFTDYTDVIQNEDLSTINKKIEQNLNSFDFEFDKYRADIVEDLKMSSMATDKHIQEFHKSTYESEILKSSLNKSDAITTQIKNNRMDSEKKNKLLAALRAIDDGSEENTKSEDFLIQRTERKGFLNELLQD